MQLNASSLLVFLIGNAAYTTLASAADPEHKALRVVYHHKEHPKHHHAHDRLNLARISDGHNSGVVEKHLLATDSSAAKLIASHAEVGKEELTADVNWIYWAIFGSLACIPCCCCLGTLGWIAKDAQDVPPEPMASKAESPSPQPQSSAKETGITGARLVEIGNGLVEYLKPKEQQLKDICIERAQNFKDRAKLFILGELDGAASSIMQQIEKEENLLMLEWNAAIETTVPPLAVCLAGLLSPTILALSRLSHTLQLLIMFLPVWLLSVWAIYNDWGEPCVIPGITAWIWSTAIVSTILVFSHLMSISIISGGQQEIKAKSDDFDRRMIAINADGEVDISERREIILWSSLMLQLAVLTEDRVAKSPWHQLIGAGTLIWTILNIWNFGIVSWASVPGTIAFHPSVAEAAADVYCGARGSVLTARVALILVVLFFFVNVFQVIFWVVDNFIHSQKFIDQVYGAARKADQNMLGIPVVELLVKSFLFRGGSDLSNAKFNVAMSEKVLLSREREEIRLELEQMDKQIRAVRARAEAIKEIPDIQECIQQLEATGKEEVDAWTKKGEMLITQYAQEDAERQIQLTKAGAAKEWNKMVERVMDMAKQMQESESVQQALAEARRLEEEAEKMAHEAAEKAKEMAAQAAEQAQILSEEAQKKALELAEQLPDQEQVKEMANKAAQHAKEVGEQGMKKAAELAEQLPDQEQVKEMANQAAQQAKAVGEQGMKKVQEAAEQLPDAEAVRKAAADATDKAASAASDAAAVAKDKAKEAGAAASAAAEQAKDKAKEAGAAASAAAEQAKK